ncbi:hypothetical protein Pmar_PMAR024913, partial [Perkinsus marinus ATCC 50983]
VLTRRGLRFAEMLGVKEQLLSHTVPVYGRTMHDLNVQDEAEKAGVCIHFDRTLSLEDTSLEDRRLCFHDSAGGKHFVDLSLNTAVVGCDGAGSRLRHALSNAGVLTFTEEMIGHGYKEITFPALSTSDGSWGLGTAPLVKITMPSRE